MPPSYFGLHMHRMVEPQPWLPNGDKLTPWPSVNFGSWRLWDAYAVWSNLEPERGKWKFSTLDKYVDLAKRNGIELLLPLGSPPAWASARPDERSSYRPGNAAEPRDIEDWRNYVRTVATRYKGRIRTYELWNEVNIKGFYSGSQENLIELARVAFETLKSVDPENILVSPSVVGGGKNLQWLDEYLTKGGGQYADVIGYHFYVPKDAPEAIVPLIRDVQDIMRKHNLEHKALWNTETGWWITNTDGTPYGAGADTTWKRLAPNEAAGYVARVLVLGKWAGLERFYWYDWDGGVMGLIEYSTKELKPSGRAYGTTFKWLVGNTLRSCEHADTIWSCALASPRGETSWLIWSSAGSGSWNAPAGWRADLLEDLEGKTTKPADELHIPVTESPVRVVGNLD